jgi:RNA polymerase sigma-70 factor (ECF subfamily)
LSEQLQRVHLCLLWGKMYPAADWQSAPPACNRNSRDHEFSSRTSRWQFSRIGLRAVVSASPHGIIGPSDMESTRDIPRLLGEIRNGNKAAVDQLLPLVYPELHRIAANYFRRERPDHTLQPTALVNEAYLRLVDQRLAGLDDKLQFLGVAAILMRRILLKHARSRSAAKRGNAAQAVPLEDAMVACEQRADELIAIDEALSRLAALDPEQAHLVELRFFGGLSFEEAAQVTGLSLATVKRRWASARAWLATQVSGRADNAPN